MTQQNPTRAFLLLSVMMVVVPAIGSATEELLQDTLKSALVAFFTLSAALMFFWDQRKKAAKIHFHGLLLLPLGLFAYALGSMLWSHGYLGGVEASRWFIFGLIVFVGSNTGTDIGTDSRVTSLAWGVHLGAVLASLWTALQFWFDWKFFAQGPNPASTFVNRNFFAEFVVCALPFSVLLLTRVRDKASVFLLTFSLAFNVTALMMTGTRSALLGLLLLLVLLPVIVVMYRKQFVSSGWRATHSMAVIALFVGTIAVLGSIETHNAKLIGESGPGTAIDRAFTRTASMTKASEYTAGSFSIRAAMWKTTGRMILAHPVAGVGAGAWEVQMPRFQDPANVLETDYYAHNEILQLLAEYGLVGWLFLISLVSYLVWAAWKTRSDKTPGGLKDAPVRACALATLLVLLLVSNAGFPWRLASTGALFALNLSLLAASDIRLGHGSRLIQLATQWQPRQLWWAMGAMALCTALAMYVVQQAVECESKIVRAVKIALTISSSARPKDPDWDKAKAEMLTLVREGIAINPHYRKLTPMVADAMATWGDWKNAIWIWESILESRPHVVALLTNLAKGHMQTGNFTKAQDALQRAKALQPGSLQTGGLEVVLMSKLGKDGDAARRAKAFLDAGSRDYDLVRFSYFLGMRIRDPGLAILALETRIKYWPNEAVDSWLKLGKIYDAPEARDEGKALEAYRAALAASPESGRSAVLEMIPAKHRSKLQ